MDYIYLKDVTFTYRGNNKPALLKINLKIKEGEFVLITGPSGCGKSTLCRLLNGLIPHFYSGELSGEIKVLGISVIDTPTYELAKYVGMVFQDPENQLFLSTVEREIAFGLENLGLPVKEIKERVEAVISFMGLESIRDKAPYELSGGQQQKVAIASVLAMQPRILVLDEPTANLDPYSSMELLDMIARLNRERKMTIVLVEHRLEALLDKVSRLIIMDNGRIILNDIPSRVIIDKKAKIVGVPKVIEVYEKLKNYGIDFGNPPLSPEELVNMIKSRVGAVERGSRRG